MKTINFLFVLLFSTSLFAQTKLTKKEIRELPNTIENEFKKAYGLSNTWKEYKMIPRNEFLVFQKNVLDSVTILRKEIVARQEIVDSQKKEIATLNENVSKVSNDLTSSQDKENQISVLGIATSKSTYNMFTWSLIGILLLALIFFISKFKSSNILTKKAKNDLSEIELELETFRKKSLEKEQKLRRQLQDEINKQRGV
ncbi:hypothetical protein [Tenacibaculum jejuense]|uniref:tRNA (Guanine-N1)-methyltransferase n=1 Tax=Tenacibaculum jejuense TaxID=584609 RepID=A0A238U8W4_9FLAO|nr:hypothetical protein [Tenacibaculum jejuense]SNR14850.1 conserved exported protein of unknown function [Tenacibaculum jejuense]